MAIDFRVQDFRYPIAIGRLRRTLERTQWLPREELKAYQLERLRAVLRQASARVPFYRDLFKQRGVKAEDIHSAEDLARLLPLLSKEAVRKAGDRLLAEDAARYSPRPYSTSGSTGAPVTFYLDKGANILEFVYYWRHWSWAGYRLGDRFAELGSQYFLNRPHLRNAACSWQPHLRRLMLNSSRISVESAREVGNAIRKYRPRFLKGMASPVYFLALSLKEAGSNDLSLRAVFSTGEVITPAYRAMAEQVFHCKVLDSYGHMERTAGISQCLEGGYHVVDDYGLLEVIDRKPGLGGDSSSGQVVGTGLYNMAMPLIRYEVGDTIELFDEGRSCACGRTLPLVKAIHGRQEDVVVTPDGRYITSIFILPEFVRGVRFAQFVQETEKTLSIRVVPGAGWDSAQAEALQARAGDLVGPGMDIRIVQILEEDILTDPSGKRRAVISHANRTS